VRTTGGRANELGRPAAITTLQLITGRGLHPFPFQLYLSSFVHRMTKINSRTCPELLKLCFNANEGKPLITGGSGSGVPSGTRGSAARAPPAATIPVRVRDRSSLRPTPPAPLVVDRFGVLSRPVAEAATGIAQGLAEASRVSVWRCRLSQ